LVRTEAVLGVLSQILWALMVIVTAKYVLILLHVDNNREDGILSLMARALKAEPEHASYGERQNAPRTTILNSVEYQHGRNRNEAESCEGTHGEGVWDLRRGWSATYPRSRQAPILAYSTTTRA
jgi:hypothetical protein